MTHPSPPGSSEHGPPEPQNPLAHQPPPAYQSPPEAHGPQHQAPPPGYGGFQPPPPGYQPQPVHGGPYPPQYPYAYQQALPRPPAVDPKELRPRTRWYWIGGLTIPGGGLVSFLVFLGLLLSATAEPEFIAEFEGGDSATFQVEEGQEGHWGLYVEDEANRFACELDTPSGPGFGNDNLDTPPHSYSGTAYDSWRLTAELSTPEPGEYVLRCDDLHPGTYGIGTLEQTASAEAKLITGVLTLVILGPLGFIAGLVIVIVTAVRRSSHRSRLVRERAWGPAPGPHGPAPQNPGPQGPPPYGPGAQGPPPHGPGPHGPPPENSTGNAPDHGQN